MRAAELVRQLGARVQVLRCVLSCISFSCAFDGGETGRSRDHPLKRCTRFGRGSGHSGCTRRKSSARCTCGASTPSEAAGILYVGRSIPGTRWWPKEGNHAQGQYLVGNGTRGCLHTCRCHWTIAWQSVASTLHRRPEAWVGLPVTRETADMKVTTSTQTPGGYYRGPGPCTGVSRNHLVPHSGHQARRKWAPDALERTALHSHRVRSAHICGWSVPR